MITLVFLAACGKRTTSDSTPTPAPARHPLCEPVPAMTCADDAVPVQGCIGMGPPQSPSPSDPATRQCYARSTEPTDLRAACKQLLTGACPTFLEYAVDNGMLDPTFEGSEYSSWYPDTGSDLLSAHHWEAAEDCTTSSGRHFSLYGTEDLLTNETIQYVISDITTFLVFDELGHLEAISRQGPTCCSEDNADAAWWGNPHHPMSSWCFDNPSCDPYECVRLTPDNIRARLESQRRRGAGRR